MSNYYTIKHKNPQLEWPQRSNRKYDPEVIASYPSKEAAMAATGIGRIAYSQIKHKNPHLDWPSAKRGRPRHPYSTRKGTQK